MKSISIRVDDELYHKIRHICDAEFRSFNGQILFLMRRCVEEYEQKCESAPCSGHCADGVEKNPVQQEKTVV